MATKLGTLTLDLVARIGSFTQGMSQASASAEREMRRVENSVVTVDGLIKKLAVTAGAAFSISQFSGMADGYIALQNRLKLVTTSQQELTQATNDTYRIAQETAQSWDSTAQVYQRFAQNAKALGINLSQAATLTETVTKAIAISGGTATSAEAALVQFGQALSSGILRGEEYNSIAEQAGGLRDAIAKGLNISVGDLRKWANDGKLTTDVVIKALGKAQDSVSDLFGKTDFTGAQGWVLIKDAATKTIGEFSKATGATQALFESLKAVSENMGSIASAMGVGTAFLVGTYIPAMYGTVAAGYAKTKQMIDQTVIQYALVNAERTAAATNLAQAQAQLINTQSTLAALVAEKALEVQRLQAQINSVGRMASTTRMAQLRQIEVQVTAELTLAENALAAARVRSATAGAASMGVGRAALGILGGPVGMGVTLAAVAAGYLLMKDGSEKATASINIQGVSMDNLIVKYRELNTLQRDNEIKAVADQVESLSLKYRVAASDLFSFMEALPISDEKIATFTKLNSQLSQGRISSDDYYKAVKNVNILTEDQLTKVRGLIGGYVDGKKKFNEAEVAQKALATAVGQTTTGMEKQVVATAKLNEELKKLLSSNADATRKNNYIAGMVNLKVDPKLAELTYEARKTSGLLGTGKALTDEARNSVLKLWESELLRNKSIEDRNKLEEKTKKNLEAQGDAMKVNAKVAENAAKYNFAKTEQKYNLPAGLLSAIHMQESRGNANAIGPKTKYGTAKGGFQFLDGTAKRFGLNGNDAFDLSKSSEAAAKYFKFLIAKFDGDLNKAIGAYHAGEGNVEKGTNIGPVNRQYVKNINGYLGGASGQKFSEEYSYDDYLKEVDKFVAEREKREKEMAAKQKEITLNVASEEVRIRSKLADDIEEINKAEFTPEKSAEIIAEYQKRADIDIQIAKAAHSDKLSAFSDYTKSEEQLINESYARRQRDLKQDIQFGIEAYTEASLHLEKQRVQELQRARWHALEIQQSMHDAIAGLSVGADDIFAKATMSPQNYGRWAIANDHSNAQADLKKQRVGVEQDIMTSSAYSTDEDRYEALLEAHQEYRDGMAAIDVAYDQQVRDLEVQNYEDKLDVYGMLLSQAGTVWGTMTQMVKDSSGEQSGAYKTMFLMQQAIAIGQAIISTELASIKALELGPVFGIPASALVRGMGYASVGLIAAQTVAGMAHDGIDNIPKEGTWLLDKGERVVDKRTNSDLKDYLSTNKSGSGVTVNINVPAGYTAKESRDSNGNVTVNVVKQMINEEINSIGNPNSTASRTIQNTFGLAPAR